MKITNIQNTCFNDGPGIRTTIFCKGCSLHCPWCCNPECIIGEKEFPSKKISNDKILQQLILQKPYIKNGGVTFSGGECLLQLHNNIELLKMIKQENLNICIETSLFCNKKKLIDIVDYIDLFLIDVKILDNTICKNVLGGNVLDFYANLNIIKNNNKKFIFRMITINEYTLTDNNLFLINELLNNYSPESFEYFNFHNLAKKKYFKLNLPFLEFKNASIVNINKLNRILESHNIKYKELTL